MCLCLALRNVSFISSFPAEQIQKQQTDVGPQRPWIQGETTFFELNNLPASQHDNHDPEKLLSTLQTVSLLHLQAALLHGPLNTPGCFHAGSYSGFYGSGII